MGLQKTFKNHFARDLINDFNADTNNQYFIYFGKVDTWDDDNSPDALIDSVQAEYINVLIMEVIQNPLQNQLIQNQKLKHLVMMDINGSSWVK